MSFVIKFQHLLFVLKRSCICYIIGRTEPLTLTNPFRKNATRYFSRLHDYVSTAAELWKTQRNIGTEKVAQWKLKLEKINICNTGKDSDILILL